MAACQTVRIPGCGPVTRLGLGTWATFGDGVDFVDARQIVFRALDRGLNYIDTAASYANGVAEEWLGRFLTAADRDHIVVSTKVFHVQNAERGPSIGGLGRKAIFQSVEASLKRLRTERIDLLYCHRPDDDTPLDETLTAVSDLIRQGKVGAWGVSRWSADLLKRANELGEAIGIGAPAAVQEPWNLLRPDAAEAIRSVLKPETKLVGYSILAGGVLTGKYLDGVPPASRLSVSRDAGKGWSVDATQADAIRALVAAAHQQGIAASTLVAVHALRSLVCDVLLTGASGVVQLDALADALQLARDEAVITNMGYFGFGKSGSHSD